MLLGLLLFTMCLMLQVYAVWSSLCRSDSTLGSQSLPSHPWQLILPAGAVGSVLLHAAGLFSTSFILAEGQMLCFLVATFAVLLLHAAVTASLQSPTVSVDVHADSRRCCSGGHASSCQGQCMFCPAPAAADPCEAAKSRAQPFADKPGDESHGQSKILTGDQQKGSEQQLGLNRHCSHAALLGVGMLVCNALMGSMGVVTRTGHDAMHKAAAMPEAEQHLQNTTRAVPYHLAFHTSTQDSTSAVTSMQWLSAALQQTQELSAPAFCALIFPFVLLDAKADLAAVRKTQHSPASLQAFAVKLVWFSYSVLAFYWALFQAGQADESLASHMKPVVSMLQSCRQVRRVLIAVAACVPAAFLVDISCLHQPLNIVLPRLISLGSVLALLIHLLSRVSHQLQFRDAMLHQENSTGSHTLIAALAAHLMLVCGPSKALVCALALLQSTCVVQLLQHLQGHWHPTPQHTPRNTTAASKEMGGWLGVAEGCLWALLSMQLFFCTGHFCEFAGLQYAAGRP